MLRRARHDVAQADAERLEVGLKWAMWRRGQFLERSAAAARFLMMRSSTSVIFITQVTL
jgi:hypothetical protein